MCNLYNLTTTQRAILEWTKAMRDLTGFNEPSRDVYPNFLAPVVRVGEDGQREVVPLQWGMPTPPDRVKSKADYGTTNIRNPQYAHWRQYLEETNRCIVPVTSFAEPSPKPADKDPETGIQRNFWFATAPDRPLFAFAGLLDQVARRSKGSGRRAGFRIVRLLHDRPEQCREANP